MVFRIVRVWVVSAGLGSLLAGMAASASAASACAESSPLVFAMSVQAGAVGPGADDRIEVHVHEDGCVAVHRPWFLRDPGVHELRLNAEERQALLNEVDVAALQGIDQRALTAQGAAQPRDADGVRYHATDVDRRVFYWREGEELRNLTFDGDLEAATTRAQAPAGTAFARAARALQALAQRPGKRVDAGSTP